MKMPFVWLSDVNSYGVDAIRTGSHGFAWMSSIDCANLDLVHAFHLFNSPGPADQWNQRKWNYCGKYYAHRTRYYMSVDGWRRLPQAVSSPCCTSAAAADCSANTFRVAKPLPRFALATRTTRGARPLTCMPSSIRESFAWSLLSSSSAVSRLHSSLTCWSMILRFLYGQRNPPRPRRRNSIARTSSRSTRRPMKLGSESRGRWARIIWNTYSHRSVSTRVIHFAFCSFIMYAPYSL